MGLFNFWKKNENKKLEDLINNIREIKDEFKRQQAEFTAEVEKWRKEAQEREERMRKQEESSTVIIQFYPGKELFVIIDGEILHSEDISKERFDQLVELRKAKDVLGIRRLLIPDMAKSEVEKVEEEIAEKEKTLFEPDALIEKVLDRTLCLVETGDFEVKGNSLQLKGIERSIPKYMVDEFYRLAVENRTEELEALKNFWRWVVLNPNVAATEEFYKLVEKYQIKLTKEGFILAYRWVQSIDGRRNDKDVKLIEFVSEQWAKVKKAKKGVKNYEVYSVGNEFVSVGFGKKPEGDATHIGNLDELYTLVKEQKLQEGQAYTDGWTKRMDIRIGQPVKMNRKDCDESGESCSRGLHAAFNLKDYLGNGDTKLLIAICPRDIVSVPWNESKFRCCEYLPLAVVTDVHNHDTTQFLQDGEGLDLLEDYFQVKVDELREQAEKNTVKELTQHRLLPEWLAGVDEEEAQEEVETIVEAFQDQLNLKGRIKNID